MSIVKGLHHVHLKCLPDQITDVLDFYENVIGLRLMCLQPDCAILDTGNGVFEIFCDADHLLGQGDFRHIAFLTDDTDAAIKKCKEYGCKIKEEPVNVTFGLDKPTPARIAFVYGPVGEEIEFFQIRSI